MTTRLYARKDVVCVCVLGCFVQKRSFDVGNCRRVWFTFYRCKSICCHEGTEKRSVRCKKCVCVCARVQTIGPGGSRFTLSGCGHVSSTNMTDTENCFFLIIEFLNARYKRFMKTVLKYFARKRVFRCDPTNFFTFNIDSSTLYEYYDLKYKIKKIFL